MWKSRRALGPRTTIAVYCESSQTTLLPTGGSKEARFSSIHCHRFRETSGSTALSGIQPYRGSLTERLQLLVEFGQALSQPGYLGPLAFDDVGPSLLHEPRAGEQVLCALNLGNSALAVALQAGPLLLDVDHPGERHVERGIARD